MTFEQNQKSANSDHEMCLKALSNLFYMVKGYKNANILVHVMN